MGMGIEEMVGGMLEIAFKAFLAGIAVGKQQITGLPPHHFQRCCLVFLFHTVFLDFTILHFMLGSGLLFCTSRRSGGPLSRIPFEPGGFPVSGRAAAKDDALRIPIYPCIRVSGGGPDFTG